MSNTDRTKGYSDEDIENFLDLAQNIGVGPARKELGYPKSSRTGYYWLKKAGIDPPSVDDLSKKANAMKDFYTDSEKRLALQEMLELIHYKLMNENLSPDEIGRLALAAQRTIQTMQLVEGKETSRVVIEDTLDADLRALIQHEQSKNAEAEADIESRFGS